MTASTAIVQMTAAPSMRGRVLALLGSTPIGGPVVGIVAQRFGARYRRALGALAAGVFGMAKVARPAPPARPGRHALERPPRCWNTPVATWADAVGAAPHRARRPVTSALGTVALCAVTLWAAGSASPGRLDDLELADTTKGGPP